MSRRDEWVCRAVPGRRLGFHATGRGGSGRCLAAPGTVAKAGWLWTWCGTSSIGCRPSSVTERRTPLPAGPSVDMDPANGMVDDERRHPVAARPSGPGRSRFRPPESWPSSTRRRRHDVHRPRRADPYVGPGAPRGWTKRSTGLRWFARVDRDEVGAGGACASSPMATLGGSNGTPEGARLPPPGRRRRRGGRLGAVRPRVACRPGTRRTGPPRPWGRGPGSRG